ncbi:UDP-glucose 4-epimerase GalE [Deinococcus roseus]|uniref:UDP-glucose 4-epimerase n=1 Tax=Deinococcus roseus TaxID=392414 RepID=A0ABQ2CXC4_9DEIO|nr:UDP-glucose 4-epimerase GalE [Deinococcus roseus]GGJ30252.1 UDP-glucose 4-epimerase GalE [Deinococcus roseus]
MKVLITGGAGYIGSTISSALLDQGHTPIILDSLIRGRSEFVHDRIFYQGDIADQDLIKRIFAEHPDIYATIHCAALILVPESTENPLGYYRANVQKSLDLFDALMQVGCNRVIFSSTASLYDAVEGFSVDESSPLKPSSPYSRTKLCMELALEDFARAYDFRAITLRYFNPIGADPKLRSGQQLERVSHALDKIIEAHTLGETFFITGTDWPTRDGSGIRDYIHVWDLAKAHIRAVLEFDRVFSECTTEKYRVYNLGTGNGTTVFELVQAFENVIGHPIKKQLAPPRSGDVAGAYPNPHRANTELGWYPESSLETAIELALQWFEKRKTFLGLSF